DRLLLYDALGARLVEALHFADERSDTSEVQGEERPCERLGVLPRFRRGHDLVDGFCPEPSADRARVAGLRGLPRDLARVGGENLGPRDRKSTRLNSSHVSISYAVFCLKKKIQIDYEPLPTVIYAETSL